MLTQTVAKRVYDFSHTVGGRELLGVVALALGPEDDVYCIIRSGQLNNVTRVTIGTVGGDEEVVGVFGRRGEGDGEFIMAAGIAIDSRQNFYVTDEWLGRVSVFDGEGSFLRRWGTPGDGDGQLNRPSGIAVDRNDDLYVVDTLNHRVQKMSREGDYLTQWGSHGDGPGEFDCPWGITIDRDGYVYVADHKNHRAQKFAADGEFVAEFGSYGSGRGELDRPSDVAVDPDGDIYVCDWANNRVQAFGPDGKFITSLIGDAQQLSKWFQQTVDANADVIKARRRVSTLEPEWRFAMPTGVVFDSDKSRLIVADTQRRRVQIYNKLQDYVDAQANL